MWMAAGFTMLEAGLVRAKNVSEIVTKNLGLYSIACVMYLVCGFFLMYPGDSVYNAYFPMIGSTWGMSLDGLTFNTDLGYSDAADFFLPGSFRCDSNVNYFWSSCRKNEVNSIFPYLP